MYKIILRSKEEAEEFYKLLKALFILQTELGNRYHFTTQINSNNGIEFLYEGKKITYRDLPEFIKEKYITTEATIKKFNQEAFELEFKLKDLKDEAKKKDAEYFIKQKETIFFSGRHTHRYDFIHLIKVGKSIVYNTRHSLVKCLNFAVNLFG